MSGKRVPMMSGVILDGYGEMAVNSWVEDEYYVDSNGIMINNQWLQLVNREHQRRYR